MLDPTMFADPAGSMIRSFMANPERFKRPVPRPLNVGMIKRSLDENGNLIPPQLAGMGDPRSLMGDELIMNRPGMMQNNPGQPSPAMLSPSPLTPGKIPSFSGDGGMGDVATSDPEAMPAAAAPSGAGEGRTIGGRINDFLGSDASLGLAAGILQGGTNSEAVGRGFAYALQAQQADNADQKTEAAANRTADFLAAKGADPALVELARSGGGGEALKMYLSGQSAPQDAFKDIVVVRKEFEAQPGVNRYRVAAPILKSMISAADDKSAMSDLDFVYGMAKIYDPTSVVREGEMGLVLAGQSIPGWITGMFEKISQGKATLQPDARKQLIAATGKRVAAYHQQAEDEANYYGGLAKKFGYDPSTIVRPLDDMPDLSPFDAYSKMSSDKGGSVGGNAGGLNWSVVQ